MWYNSDSIHPLFKREKCAWQSREKPKQQEAMPELYPLKNVKSTAVNTVPDCFYSCKIIQACCGGLFPATAKGLFPSVSFQEALLTPVSTSSPRFMLQEA